MSWVIDFRDSLCSSMDLLDDFLISSFCARASPNLKPMIRVGRSANSKAKECLEANGVDVCRSRDAWLSQKCSRRMRGGTEITACATPTRKVSIK